MADVSHLAFHAGISTLGSVGRQKWNRRSFTPKTAHSSKPHASKPMFEPPSKKEAKQVPSFTSYQSPPEDDFPPLGTMIMMTHHLHRCGQFLQHSVSTHRVNSDFVEFSEDLLALTKQVGIEEVQAKHFIFQILRATDMSFFENRSTPRV